MPKKIYQNLVFITVALLCISSSNVLTKAPDYYHHAKKKIYLKACHMEKASHIKRANVWNGSSHIG